MESYFVYVFQTKPNPHLDELESGNLARLTVGAPKSKEEIRNPEILCTVSLCDL
jgi:hypothetical protein